MTLLGTRRTVTAGVAPGQRPSVTLVGTLNKKMRLDLGSEIVLIALGSSPLGVLHALRDDLDKILEEST